MQTVDDLGVSYTRLEQLASEKEATLFERLYGKRLLLVLCVAAVALSVRVYRLGAAGLAEDEANKVFAVRSYEQGDFTANADHPMLMKMLCYGSLQAVAICNRLVASRASLAISEEAALRLPNAIFGAITVIPLFFFTNALYGFRVGLITSVLWALGLNAIWFNRVAKEDTLLVFFMLTGFYLYHLAKSRPASELAEQTRLYALAGAAFGLMLASKYFPHYYGLFMLFYHLGGRDSRNNRPLTSRMKAYHFGAMLLAFVVFNFAVFIPKTWRYLSKYVAEDLLTHHGYVMMGRLYLNDISATPDGTPWYFYLLYLAVKVPIPLTLAFLIGAIEVFRRREPSPDSRGYLFLRIMLIFWLLPMSLVGSKFLRYSLSLMPIIYITSAIAITRIWHKLSTRITRGSAQAVARAAVAVVFVIAPSAISIANLPHLSLYTNLLGGFRVGYFFPHDEFYDLGARESIRYIAEHAPKGATVASEIPGVVEYYLERFGRTDMRSLIMSHPKFNFKSDPPDYVLLQPGRLYFENQEDFRLIKATCPVAQASAFKGAIAAEVYITKSYHPKPEVTDF
jgi:hypothetical protein